MKLTYDKKVNRYILVDCPVSPGIKWEKHPRGYGTQWESEAVLFRVHANQTAVAQLEKMLYRVYITIGQLMSKEDIARAEAKRNLKQYDGLDQLGQLMYRIQEMQVFRGKRKVAPSVSMQDPVGRKRSKVKKQKTLA